MTNIDNGVVMQEKEVGATKNYKKIKKRPRFKQKETCDRYRLANQRR